MTVLPTLLFTPIREIPTFSYTYSLKMTALSGAASLTFKSTIGSTPPPPSPRQ